MIDEKRVRRMTRMAAYEEREGVQDEKVNAYFGGDYVTRQVLLTFISSTVAYIILFGMYAVYTFEDLIGRINQEGFQSFLRQFALYYVVFLIVMTAITIVVYSFRYHRARKHLAAYYRDLQKLSASYRRKG